MFDTNSLPMIRLEIQNMKHTIVHALAQYQAMFDADLQASIERFCTPENVARIIDDEARQVMERAVRETVDNWFVYGPGRTIIKDAVKEKLKVMFEVKTE